MKAFSSAFASKAFHLTFTTQPTSNAVFRLISWLRGEVFDTSKTSDSKVYTYVAPDGTG